VSALLALLAWLGSTTPVAAAQPPRSDLAAGLAAFEAGRYDASIDLLSPALEQAPDYDGLVTLGLACGQLQRWTEARRAFERAITLAPARPAAYVERGGLAFLEKDYVRASADLRRGLRYGAADPDYARDLLATALYLGGQSDAALLEWNRLGRPRLERIIVSGLQRTREDLARRELGLADGDLLTLAALRRGRLRLQEWGSFERVTLRPEPRGAGLAALRVDLAERHGLFVTPLDFALTSAVGAIQGRARLRYVNLAGRGVNLGAQVRWQARRPEIAFDGDWPRPFGLPVSLRLSGFRGRQAYDLDTPFERRSRGFDVIVRHVAAARTVVQLDWRGRWRTFSLARADAAPGRILGLELGLEQRLAETNRLRLDAGLRAFVSGRALGSEHTFTRVVATLDGRVFLAPSEGQTMERSVWAWRLRTGWGSRRMPLDEAFAPGGSPEMELPLRAHRQLENGALGGTALGRGLWLGNTEWRRRLWNGRAVAVGFVTFYDGARVTGRPGTARGASYHDVGLGLRLAARGGSLVRVDFGHGLADGQNALFLGLQQVF
jgi:hypothetical protein